MNMQLFILILVLGVTVEALVEYGSGIFIKGQIQWKQVGAIGVSVLLAFGLQADLYAALGVSFAIPYLGMVLTGIFASRGSNYLADLITLIQSKITATKV